MYEFVKHGFVHACFITGIFRFAYSPQLHWKWRLFQSCINFVKYFSPMIHVVNPEAPWSTPHTPTTFFLIVFLVKNVQERS